ncbi:MAG: hypothetical protein C3F17_01720 [Bradyrhizobiaceae bacterium]|nr:MAG: hypothetical protein C3F17_01720 [Bradyrhizobiaceae bacterium]
MTQSTQQPTAAPRQLSDAELDLVSGGMKWDRNHKSNDVIDARGGQVKTWFGTFTLDVNGKISSFTPA